MKEPTEKEIDNAINVLAKAMGKDIAKHIIKFMECAGDFKRLK